MHMRYAVVKKLDENTQRVAEEVTRRLNSGGWTADEQHPAESRGDRDGRPDLQFKYRHPDGRRRAWPFYRSCRRWTAPIPMQPDFTQMSLLPPPWRNRLNRSPNHKRRQRPRFSVGMVPEQAVERILSAGTNEPAGALRIYAQYQAGAPAGEMAVSLRKEFGTGGRGFTIDGTPYAVWLMKTGFLSTAAKAPAMTKRACACPGRR